MSLYLEWTKDEASGGLVTLTGDSSARLACPSPASIAGIITRSPVNLENSEVSVTAPRTVGRIGLFVKKTSLRQDPPAQERVYIARDLIFGVQCNAGWSNDDTFVDPKSPEAVETLTLRFTRVGGILTCTWLVDGVVFRTLTLPGWILESADSVYVTVYASAASDGGYGTQVGTVPIVLGDPRILSVLVDACDSLAGWVMDKPQPGTEGSLTVDSSFFVTVPSSLRMFAGAGNWVVYYSKDSPYTQWFNYSSTPFLRLKLRKTLLALPVALNLITAEGATEWTSYEYSPVPTMVMGQVKDYRVDLRVPLAGTPDLTKIRRLAFLLNNGSWIPEPGFTVNIDQIMRETDPSLPLPPLQSSVTPTTAETQVGGSLTFTGQAGGVAPFTYQWLVDGVAVPGQTQPTLILQSASPASYAVALRVRDALGREGTSVPAVAVFSAALVALTVNSNIQVPVTVDGVPRGPTPLTVQISPGEDHLVSVPPEMEV